MVDHIDELRAFFDSMSYPTAYLSQEIQAKRCDYTKKLHFFKLVACMNI